MADLITSGIQVNQSVYDLLYGIGIVTKVDVLLEMPITVKFATIGKSLSYYTTGKPNISANRTLYFNQPTITEVAGNIIDWSLVSANTPVEVSTDGITWIPADFISYNAGNPLPYLVTNGGLPTSSATGATFYAYIRQP